MEQSEVMRRVVGVLTQTTDWRRRLIENPDRTDVDTEGGVDAVAALLNETMPSFEFQAGALAEDIAPVMAKEIGQAVMHLVGAFSMAFTQLADVHDSGRTDIASDDVLRDLAIRADELFDDGAA